MIIFRETYIFLEVSSICPVSPKFLSCKKYGLYGGKSIAAWSQFISGVSAINPLAAFYDIHGRKGEVLFVSSTPNTTRD
jgi:hypothetical protein